MPYKDLFLFPACLPLLLMVYLAIQRILIVMESYLSILSFMVINFLCVFYVCLPQDCEEGLVFFEAFVVLLFTLRSVIVDLDLVFLCGVSRESEFISPAMDIQWTQLPLLKR